MTPTAPISPIDSVLLKESPADARQDAHRWRWQALARVCNAALALLLGILLLATLSPAVAAERDLPIRIQADTATLDDQTGVSVYRGNVVVTQGDMVIHADTLTVHTPGRTLKRMEAEGQMARLRTLTEDGRELRAESLRMEYLAEARHVVFTGRARIWQAADEFRGERIVYDLGRETLDAEAGETGRVEVIITPRDAQ